MNDLAWGEVIPGRLVRELVEAPYQVFEHQSHLVVRHRLGMQVDVAEFLDDKIEDVGLAHPLDFVPELEIIEDAAHVGGKAIDIAGQVLVDVIWITLQALKVEGRAIVKSVPGCLIQNAIERVVCKFSALAPFELRENFGFCICKHTVKTAQYYERQHDTLVLRWPIRTAQEVRYLPDQIGKVGMAGHVTRIFPSGCPTASY
jgi:hypothetical protein